MGRDAIEPETLPSRALSVLRDTQNEFLLSDISLFEASTLSRKGRVDLGMPFDEWLERALPHSLEVLPISARVALAENGLPDTFRGDPADRLIASTAIAHDLALLTPDQKIAFHRVCTTIRYRWPRSKRRR